MQKIRNRSIDLKKYNLISLLNFVSKKVYIDYLNELDTFGEIGAG